MLSSIHIAEIFLGVAFFIFLLTSLLYNLNWFVPAALIVESGSKPLVSAPLGKELLVYYTLSLRIPLFLVVEVVVL